MKKSFPLLLIAMVAVFAISGCTGTPKTTAFVGGTDGLKMSFADLPSTIFANVPFQLAVLVQNAGESAIEVGSATFTLNNAQNFNILVTDATTRNKGLLQAAKIVQATIFPGGQEFITWGPAKFTGEAGIPITEQQPVPIAVDACYGYSTTMITRVCIAKGKQICEPIAEKVIQNSGAPIQITKFKQIAQAENDTVTLNFKIDVENKGGGDVYTAGATCPTPDSNSKDIFYVDKVILGDEVYAPQSLLNCDSIELSDNEGSTTCSITIPSVKTDYEEQLSIVLNYTYKQKLTAKIAIIPL
jgi:hypothetical protein